MASSPRDVEDAKPALAEEGSQGRPPDAVMKEGNVVDAQQDANEDVKVDEGASERAIGAGTEEGKNSDSQQGENGGRGGENEDEDEDDEEEEEEEETCGFCKYMKGGGCKESFVAWLNCVEKKKEEDGDYVEKCVPQMKALRECMLANTDYYGPMLEEEAHMQDDDEDKGDNVGEESGLLQPSSKDSEVMSSDRKT